MAAAFRPANNGPGLPEATHDGRSPKKSTQIPDDRVAQMHSTAPMDDATTPTRATFSRGNAGPGSNRNSTVLESQKPLPTSPFPDAVQVPEPSDQTSSSQAERSQQQSSNRGDSEDVDMDASEGEDDGGSDDGSLNADGTKSKNKKKSQRFYCTDYPPCNLSFTRSEHLARHIRKHTGERPFMCHCTRRFSRLDNLRQHAQTVHVNEDIPSDSLAMASSRFVRQVRPDRVRPNGRPRAGTASSIGAPARGHSKSLSTSSIANIGSLGSNYSNAPRDDPARRRPPPLVMADPRSRLSLESYRSGADSQYSYRAPSPSDFSTPTSATFSTGQSSPRWTSGMASPTYSHSRAHTMYPTGSQTPGRRLSVPSVAGNPFQSPHGATSAVGRPSFGPGGHNTCYSGVYSPTGSSLISSPTMSPGGGWSRRESMSEAEALEWRRRTWHVEREYSAGGSRLSRVMTHGDNSMSPATSIRLPGIESFDAPGGQATPPRRLPSPMMVDSEITSTPTLLLPDTRPRNDAHCPPQWDRDMSLHRGLTKLDITSSSSPRDSAGAWANEANSAVQAQAEHVREQIRTHPTVRFEPEPRMVSIPTTHAGPPPTNSNSFFRGHHHTMSAPSVTSRESKRHGWYHGPNSMMIHARINEGTEPKENRPHVDRMAHPNFTGFSGFPLREHPEPNLPTLGANHQPIPVNRSAEQDAERGQPKQPDTLDRFKTLVAAATGGVPTATAC